MGKSDMSGTAILTTDISGTTALSLRWVSRQLLEVPTTTLKQIGLPNKYRMRTLISIADLGGSRLCAPRD